MLLKGLGRGLRSRVSWSSTINAWDLGGGGGCTGRPAGGPGRVACGPIFGVEEREQEEDVRLLVRRRRQVVHLRVTAARPPGPPGPPRLIELHSRGLVSSSSLGEGRKERVVLGMEGAWDGGKGVGV